MDEVLARDCMREDTWTKTMKHERGYPQFNPLLTKYHLFLVVFAKTWIHTQLSHLKAPEIHIRAFGIVLFALTRLSEQRFHKNESSSPLLSMSTSLYVVFDKIQLSRTASQSALFWSRRLSTLDKIQET